jgi:hypothetical protein
VDILEQTDEAVIRTGDVDMEPAMFGSLPKADRNHCRAGLNVRAPSRLYLRESWSFDSALLEIEGQSETGNEQASPETGDEHREEPPCLPSSVYRSGSLVARQSSIVFRQTIAGLLWASLNVADEFLP